MDLTLDTLHGKLAGHLDDDALARVWPIIEAHAKAVFNAGWDAALRHRGEA